MITIFWFLIFVIIGVIIGSMVLETYRFNNGICRKCGHKLSLRKSLVNGQLIYECDNCHHTVTISGIKV